MTKARRYQRTGIRKIERKFNCRCLLADEMGLGKTFQALKVMQRNKRFMLPTVVICPAPLKYNWAEEAAKHVGMHAEILEGRSPEKFQQGWRTSDLLIINFEILGAWLPVLRQIDPQLIIVDEAHRIKNRSADCTKHVKKLARYCPYILMLSGTPLTNEPGELFTVLNILWPEKFNSYWSFAQRYTNAEMKPWGWQFKGAKNLPELHTDLLEIGMLRRKKKDVLKELPPVNMNVLPIRLSKPKMREYRKAKNDFLNWLGQRSKAKAVKAAKAARLVKVGYLRRLAASSKMTDVKRWIDSFLEETDEKIIVFGIHHDILEPLHEKYKKQSVLIDGNVTGQKRHARLTEFKKLKEKRLAFCNYRSGGVGLNMQEASTVLCVELPWTPTELDQAISRAHRMGQKNSVNVYVLVSEDTIEERLCRILQDKQFISDSILDGVVDEKQATLKVFDQLELELAKEAKVKGLK